MPPELNRHRALMDLRKINEILAKEAGNENERVTRW